MSLRTLQRTIRWSPMRTARTTPHRYLLTPRASISSSSITMNKPNNAEEIEKLNELIKVKLSELEATEKKRILEESKPKISDFKRPIYLTLVVASTAYLALHWTWWHLEFHEREKALESKLALKQEELLKAVDETSNTGIQKQATWKRWWKVWSN